jgi:hypothetical protein
MGHRWVYRLLGVGMLSVCVFGLWACLVRGSVWCVWMCLVCVVELASLLCCERMLTRVQMPARIRQVLVARGYDEFKRPDGWPRPRLQSHVARSSGGGRGGGDHRDSGASASNPERAGGNRKGKGKRRRRPHTPAPESSGSEGGDVI